jgi:methyl acetate hydrolase
MTSDFASRARTILDEAIAAGVPGVVAMARDRERTIFSACAGVRRLGAPAPMTEDTILALFSCTKPLTATVALRLVEDGRLDLDRPAKDYLPALGEIGLFDGLAPDGSVKMRAPKRDITARMLLLHTAGFGYDFANPLIGRLVAEGRAPSHRSQTHAGFRQPLVNEPGEAWEYGISMDWLGMVLEACAGAKLDALLREIVLDPLGMKDTGWRVPPAARGRLASMAPRETSELCPGGGGAYGTAGDYLRFLGLWFNDGAGVLKPETIAWAVRDGLDGLKVRPLPAVAPRVSGPLDFFPGAQKSWAYSFLRNDADLPTGRPAGSLAWAGLGNVYFWIDRRNGIAGFWGSQLFPFLDPASYGGALDFETALYESLAGAQLERAK